MNSYLGLKIIIKNIKILLFLVGPNELNKYDFKKLCELKNCFYLGFTNQINLLLPFAYCLILPSYREGFGSVIIEAAASKVPIIATNILVPLILLIISIMVI